MAVPIDQIKTFIVQSVTQAGNGMVGSALMSSIRRGFQDFTPSDYGCANLRTFIRNEVPEVVVVDRRGMDYLYGLASCGLESLTSSPAMSTDNPRHSDGLAVWRTFSSPNSDFKLFADRESGKLTVVPPRGGPPNDQSVHIPSLGAEGHTAIAREYIESRSEEAQKERLGSHLDKPQWWIPFYRAIQEEGLADAWNSFRRHRILEQLKRAMAQAGVPTDGLEVQLATQAPLAPKVSVATRTPNTASGPAADLRALSIKIVRNMSMQELRRLRVELGDVFDALGC